MEMRTIDANSWHFKLFRLTWKKFKGKKPIPKQIDLCTYLRFLLFGSPLLVIGAVILAVLVFVFLSIMTLITNWLKTLFFTVFLGYSRPTSWRHALYINELTEDISSGNLNEPFKRMRFPGLGLWIPLLLFPIFKYSQTEVVQEICTGIGYIMVALGALSVVAAFGIMAWVIFLSIKRSSFVQLLRTWHKERIKAKVCPIMTFTNLPEPKPAKS